MKSGVNIDSVTTRIFKYYPNGMRFYEQDIFDNDRMENIDLGIHQVRNLL